MIRKSNLFWGAVLIILGGMFLVDSLGIMNINLWSVFWPLMLILFGVWVLVGHFVREKPGEREKRAIPLENARSARIQVHHGAGRLKIGPGAGPMELASGYFGGGLDTVSRLEVDQLNVTMRARNIGFPMIVFPWFWGSQNYLDWDVQLTDEVPIDLRLKTGASDTLLDLTDLLVTNLHIETGASATEINLPDSVSYTKVVIKGGAASLKVNVPEETAARIRVSGGLMDANVDRSRFPKSGGYYQSPNYETSPYKVEIKADFGLGSVRIR